MITFEAAMHRAARMADPPDFALISGKNSDGLRRLLKIIIALSGGSGGSFFVGSLHAGGKLGVSHMSVRRWLKTLEALGLIVERWKGRRCAGDAEGRLYDGGKRVSRGSEFVYIGSDSV